MHKNWKTGRKFVVGAMAAGLVASPVLAATAAEVIKSRIAQYREIAAAYKNANDELKKGSPQPAVIQAAASQIASKAREQYKWFPKGSGPEAGVKTKAKAEIWAKPADFRKAQDAFVAQAANFQKVAAGGNVDQIKAAARTLGATCTGCHRPFRSE